ncbi:MAG: hypothetical protein WC359_13150 [Dehalococcoidia bacterium]|jgi:hypothetical protein
MTQLQQNTTHMGAGLLKLVPPFWGKPRIAALLLGYLQEIQTLEDAIWSVATGLDVDTCGRFALEGLAKIVDEPRRPASTDTLRTLVKGRITVNKSDGTPDAIATVIALLTSGTVRVLDSLEEVRVLQLTLPNPDDIDAAVGLLDDACRGGVHVCWLTNAGTGGCARPNYGDTTPDNTRRRGLVPRSNYHG